MALALGLVGQPVQPYLTSGATDFVNSVQKGKEDAIRTEGLKTQSQKSALDLLTAQKKVKDSEWVSTNANDLKARADKGDLDAASIARMQEANPEFAKILGTAQADAVKNFYASNLIGLNSATDQTGFLNGLVQAHDAHNAPLPESVRKDPKLAIQYYKMLLNGAKAFDDKTASMDESGNVITKDALGQTTDIKPAKAEKTSPVMVNGVPKTVKVPGTNEVKILNKDGTLSPGGSMPVTKPKQPRLQQVTNENGTFLLNIDTGEVKPVMIGGTQLKPVKKPEAPSGEESKSAGYAFRMGEANKILTDFEANKKGMPSYAASIAGGVPVIGDYLERKAQDQNQQLYKNAALAWLRAKLRDESGATIQNLESNNEYRTYFPLVGDEPETIKQKAKLREIAEAEMMLKAGKASTKLEQTRKDYNAKNPPAKNAQGWKLYTDKNGNKAYVSPDGKQYQKVQ